jgi:hypothetical protein
MECRVTDPPRRHMHCELGGIAYIGFLLLNDVESSSCVID